LASSPPPPFPAPLQARFRLAFPPLFGIFPTYRVQHYVGFNNMSQHLSLPRALFLRQTRHSPGLARRRLASLLPLHPRSLSELEHGPSPVHHWVLEKAERIQHYYAA
jgi:hypothetical protein